MNQYKKIASNNLPLKVASLACGFIFWVIFGAQHNTTMTLNIPLCFYGQPEGYRVEAPESIQVTLRGKRADLYDLEIDNLGLHINSDEMKAGDNIVIPTGEKLFLPPHIKLSHWNPANPIITLQHNI